MWSCLTKQIHYYYNRRSAHLDLWRHSATYPVLHRMDSRPEQDGIASSGRQHPSALETLYEVLLWLVDGRGGL